MTATITLTQQLLEITEVDDVVVTDIVQDPTAGDYVRDIRIFGKTPNLDVTSNATRPMLVQLRIRSATRDALELSAPVQSF